MVRAMGIRAMLRVSIVALAVAGCTASHPAAVGLDGAEPPVAVLPPMSAAVPMMPPGCACPPGRFALVNRIEAPCLHGAESLELGCEDDAPVVMLDGRTLAWISGVDPLHLGDGTVYLDLVMPDCDTIEGTVHTTGDCAADPQDIYGVRLP